ncbi:MAG: prepilin-type N-terminal cleavage/methylation domain-containing protein [Chthoniobacterales bacterium]|nr:prepilin-type N-terminal cleavage/methylation domain-containing protein [Chthoniobacterales bacterium]
MSIAAEIRFSLFPPEVSALFRYHRGCPSTSLVPLAPFSFDALAPAPFRYPRGLPSMSLARSPHSAFQDLSFSGFFLHPSSFCLLPCFRRSVLLSPFTFPPSSAISALLITEPIAVPASSPNSRPLQVFTLPQPRGRQSAFTLPEPRERVSAFTLVEMLVVIAIVLVLTLLLAPAFTSLKSAGDVTSAAYSIGGLLEQARSYAMANNTYVWIGFKEVDVSKDSSVSPQTIGTGRVAIAIVASRDGTRGYDASNSSLPNPAWANYNNGANLVAISKLQRFENIHFATTLNGFGNQPPTSGNMARPYIISNNYVVGNAAPSVTPFDWPLGSALNVGQYSFQKVFYFDPQGVARTQTSSNTDGIGAYMEVGLQQTNGTTVSSSPNVAALQIDCMTGSVRKYRP